jgi:chromosome segregation ATPase
MEEMRMEMKRIMKRYVFMVLALPVLLMGCDNGKLKDLEIRNNELTNQLEEMDSSMNSYLETISEIEDNLAVIKLKQNMIATNASKDVEFDHEMRKSLVNDLQAINSLMTTNKEKITELQNLLKNSNFQVAEFKKLVARVNTKLVEKDEEITSLTTRLEDLAFRNQTLDDNVRFLTIRVDTLSAVNQVQIATIQNQKKLISRNLEELSSGFVATGTLKELEEKQIIKKEGGILGLGAVSALNSEVDRDNFLRIDIQKTQTIPLMVKKVRVITNHPQDSYKIEESENGELLASLVITNPDRFWNTSKFLVVRVN